MAFANLACPKCGTTSSPGISRCPKCDTLLDLDAQLDLDATQPDLDVTQPILEARLDLDATQLMSDTGSPSAPAGWTEAAGLPRASFDSLAPGSLIGNRYEILRILGEGGMGAVYEARDRELDRVLALKVIRPELADNHEVLQMFKQELILARQVTHQNVIRIFDLGLADGLRFITMQYVEGYDLKSRLEEKGKLPPEEAAAIMMQVCEGLEAAHKQKVIHRDLKPQNIMIDAQGRALVMDFGLALSAETAGGEGKLMGTPHYMSPEQTQRRELDARSDLYTVGIIFFELLTGSLPFEAESLRQLLKSRSLETAPAPIERDPTIPKKLNDIVVKCLARDPDQRYQSATEIVYDIQVWLGIIVPPTKLWKRLSIVVGAALMVTVGVGVAIYLSRPGPPPKPLTVLVADFNNQTGEAVLDGTLEDPFAQAMEGASFISSYNRTTARREAVRQGAEKLNESGARLVALRDSLNVVITGAIAKGGADYTVSVKAVDSEGKPIAQSQIKAAKEQLLAAIPKLAQPIRKALGDRASAPANADEGNAFTASSLEAAHVYTLGAEAALAAKYEDARRYYQQALALDPNLARAYSGMAVIYRNLGDLGKAEDNLKIALSKPGLSQRERFRIRGVNYITNGSYEKAIDEYNSLLKQFPGDNAGHANVAIAYLYLRNLPRAVEEAREAIKIYPKNTGQRDNLALFLLYTGKFAEASREADEVIKLNPNFEQAYVVKALAALAAGKPDQAAEYYEQAGKASARGASYRVKGLADIALFEGRTADAATLLQAGIKADLADHDQQLFADKQVALAHTLLLRGQPKQAIAAAGQALQASKNPETQFLAARILANAGQEDQALEVAQLLSNKLGKLQQAYGKLIEGDLALKKGSLPQAIQLMVESQKLVDTWISRFDLGRAYLAAEAFSEADSEFDACIRRQGEATSLELEADPTYGYFPPAYYYAGRAQQGIGSPDAAESFRKFLALRGKATDDPLVIDAKKRAGK